MYTLVSAPVLGFDLVRRPGGEHVASLVRAALALDTDDVRVLAAARRAELPPVAAHDAAWLAVAELEASRRPVSALIGDVYEAAAAAPHPDEPGRLRSPVLVERMNALEAAPLGTLFALLRCLRHDVLDWTWRTADGVSLQGPDQARATAVLCDAVTAAYWYGVLDPAARRQLAASWTRAQRAIGSATVEAGPHADGLGRLLARLGRLDGSDLERLRVVSHRSRRMGGWAQAVHEASWATHLTDRVRTAAGVQMCAVEQFVASGVSATDSASGVWNTVSGALAAQVVADVLSDEVVDELLLPVRLALGLTD